MVSGCGPRKQVVGEPQTGQVVNDDAVVAVGKVVDVHALFIRLHQQRGAVFVGAGDHQHIVSDHALVAGKDV